MKIELSCLDKKMAIKISNEYILQGGKKKEVKIIYKYYQGHAQCYVVADKSYKTLQCFRHYLDKDIYKIARMIPSVPDNRKGYIVNIDEDELLKD